MTMPLMRPGAGGRRRTVVKFCGFTRPEDIESAVALGVDAVGVVFAHSPRRVDPDRASGLFEAAGEEVVRVGVFADQTLSLVLEAVEACGLDWVQLSGSEPAGLAAEVPVQVLKAVHVSSREDLLAYAGYPSAAFLLDAPLAFDVKGGRGVPFDWSAVRGMPLDLDRVVVAGGLSPANVGEAIRRFRPAGVDVSSGIETAPGVKDVALMAAFLDAVREAGARTEGNDGDA